MNAMDLAVYTEVTPMGASLEFNSSKLSKEMSAMSGLFETTNTALTYYLWGALKTSWVSRLVHGLNYEEALGIYKKSGDQVLLNYILGKKDSFGISQGVIIHEAEMLGPYRLYLEAEIEHRKYSMVIGYPTKNARIFFEADDGTDLVLKLSEGYGNVFSPDVELAEQADRSTIHLGDHIDTSDTRRFIERAHEKGHFVIMDAMLWVSPGVVTEKNYHFFNYHLIEGPESDKDILKNSNGVILHLSDGRRVCVHFRSDSQDQLSPDLNNYSAYWDKYLAHYMKNFIETLDVDGFRIDLALELHTGDGRNKRDYDFLKSILFETVESALKERGKRIYFALEVYDRFHRDIIRGWNKELTEELKQKNLLGKSDEYAPFNTYFPDIFRGLENSDASALIEALKWIFGDGKDSDIFYVGNFDEFALATYIPDETLRNGYMLLLILMSKAGYNTLIYPRDLIREGDLIPAVGGHRDFAGAYDAHKFLTKAEFLEKIRYKTEAEWLKNSFAYKMLNLSITIKSVEIEGHSVIFSTDEDIKVKIDLYTGEITWTSAAAESKFSDGLVIREAL